MGTRGSMSTSNVRLVGLREKLRQARAALWRAAVSRAPRQDWSRVCRGVGRPQGGRCLEHVLSGEDCCHLGDTVCAAGAQIGCRGEVLRP